MKPVSGNGSGWKTRSHSGDLPKQADQYNSLQEKLIERFREIRQPRLDSVLHFACAKDTDEDRGTVQYLQDCASEAGIRNKFTYVEDIGHGVGDVFTDIDSEQIRWMFKLYPWEFMLREDFRRFAAKIRSVLAGTSVESTGIQ